MLEEEETYEAPDDPDVGASSRSYPMTRFLFVLILFHAGLSLEELGLRALERIPRDRAIDGIHAFNEMRYVHAMPF